MEILKFAPFTKFQPTPKFSRNMKDEFLDEISSCRRRYFSYQWRWNFRYVLFQYANKFFFDLFRKLQTRCWVLYFHTATYSKSTRKDSKRWFVHYELRPSCPGKITAVGKLWRKISLDASTFSHFDFSVLIRPCLLAEVRRRFVDEVISWIADCTSGAPVTSFRSLIFLWRSIQLLTFRKKML